MARLNTFLGKNSGKGQNVTRPTVASHLYCYHVFTPFVIRLQALDQIDNKITFLGTDVEKPAFTFCPGNFEEYADSAVNYTTIQLPAINATDNSGQEPHINCSGILDKYNIGKHVVTCIARDGAGNEDTCQFSIQVRCEYFLNFDSRFITNYFERKSM